VFGALVAGLIAGLWGVTGWGGFLYYLGMHLVVRQRLSHTAHVLLCTGMASSVQASRRETE
jgi:hypothetical protein